MYLPVYYISFESYIKKLKSCYKKVKKNVLESCQSYKGGNRDYCTRFWLNFQATIKFVVVSVRLILGKNGIDGFTGPRREVTSDKKMIFISNQSYKDGNRVTAAIFLVIFETTSKFLIVFVRLILRKGKVDGLTRPWWEIGI